LAPCASRAAVCCLSSCRCDPCSLVSCIRPLPLFQSVCRGYWAAVNATQLDDELVDAFCSDALDRRGEAALARQVARVLPFHASLPNPVAVALARVIDRVGGEANLFEWLGHHPGLPRLVASVYSLVALLDRLSDCPAVVAALVETRQRVGLPASLEMRLVPDPLDPRAAPETLASLGGQLESLLRAERYTEAAETALATVDMLRQVLLRAARDDADVVRAGDELERVRHALDTAGREVPA
jgi:hypothetical protein